MKNVVGRTPVPQIIEVILASAQRVSEMVRTLDGSTGDDLPWYLHESEMTSILVRSFLLYFYLY